MIPEWPATLAEQLEVTTTELRALLRKRSHGSSADSRKPIATRRAGYDGVTISEVEARALLRGAMPVPLAMSRSRRPTHAALLAALASMAGAVLDLGDPLAQRRPGGPAGIAAALALQDALGAWIAAARWQQATQRAGVSWPKPPESVTISAVLRQSAGDSVPALFDQPAAAAKAKRPRKAHARPNRHQRSLLLPIGRQTAPAAAAAATAPAATSTAPPAPAAVASHHKVA